MSSRPRGKLHGALLALLVVACSSGDPRDPAPDAVDDDPQPDVLPVHQDAAACVEQHGRGFEGNYQVEWIQRDCQEADISPWRCDDANWLSKEAIRCLDLHDSIHSTLPGVNAAGWVELRVEGDICCGTDCLEHCPNGTYSVHALTGEILSHSSPYR